MKNQLTSLLLLMTLIIVGCNSEPKILTAQDIVDAS
ncbi:MAG: hypothetical protein ACJAZ2_002267, partial [Glaciecola sp.]